MTNFETNKKHASHAWELVAQKQIRVMLAVSFFCLGYVIGVNKVKNEAIQNGHMIMKDGVARWQPMRYIKEGI